MAEQGQDLEVKSVTGEYEKNLLSWIRQSVTQGIAVLKKEKPYGEIQNSIDYINGEQYPIRSRAISRVTDNKLRKIVLEIVSALTDVRPIWNYDTHDEQYKKQADLLNKLARAWWRNGRIDRRLQAILTYACVGGSGYGQLVWNTELPSGGDFELIPYDPRDVVPIGAVYSDSIQDWRGVILRQRVPTEDVRRMFPAKAYKVGNIKGSWFGVETGKGGRMFDVVTTMWNIMSGRNRDGQDFLPNTTDLIRCYFKDETIHTGDEPKEMGNPDSNWKYTVYPVGSMHPDGHIVTREEAKLYPRGRLVVCTPDAILEDEPNPNWHGLFPVIRFTLDPLPWSILGASIVSDLIPLQNALNEALRGAEDGIAQWIRRGVVADRNSISESNLKKIDTRKAGLQALLNPTAGEGFKLLDGPEFPQWYVEMIAFFINEMETNSGVRGLQQLTQLKQMPAADTVEQFMDALSPLLRMRGRSLEISLSELAEMLKVGFFQYYDMTRRTQILGPDGKVVEDFDYDPETMVPATVEGESREDRASIHHRNFTFSISPNSFLNVSHATQKMLMLQLFRTNGIDIYSLWEALDIPNIGHIPAENVPERMIAARKLGLQPGPTPELVQVQEAAAIVQAQVAISQAQQAIASGAMPLGTGGGQGAPGPEEVRTSGVGPQGGRPPSGQDLPQPVMRDGGQRMVISESGR